MPPSPSSTATSSSASSSIAGRHCLMKSGEKFAERSIFSGLREKSCPICLENLTGRRSSAVITTCKHGYCLACIRKWSGFKRNCPLCNTRFDSWFIVSDLASRKYRKEQLPVLRDRETLTYHRNNPSGLRRSRHVLENSSSRSRHCHGGDHSDGQVQFLILLSTIESFSGERGWFTIDYLIYNKQLRAVRLQTRRLELVNDLIKAKIGERIEPWIRRELEAVLGDPDPSIIVHFASALFIQRLERENNRQSRQTGMVVEDEETSLRKFLLDKEDLFWHELRCFAESSLTMEAYDAVVEYNEVE